MMFGILVEVFDKSQFSNLFEIYSAPRIIIIGPPAAGKHSIARLLSKSLGAVHVTIEGIKSGEVAVTPEIKKYFNLNLPMPVELWAQMVNSRLVNFHVNRKRLVKVHSLLQNERMGSRYFAVLYLVTDTINLM